MIFWEDYLLEKLKQKQNESYVKWIIFLSTLVVVLFSLTSVIFPALILRTLGGLDDNVGIDPFETGKWAYPLLATNFILLGLSILYIKNWLPNFITKSIRFLFDFEISPKIAFFIILILIGTYVSFSVSELFDEKFSADFKIRVKERIDNFQITQIGSGGIGKHFEAILNYSSVQLFGNYKVIPFLGSISMLILTYLITLEISKKRFAGIVSMVLVLQSGIFLFYDTSVAYTNYWVVFYLLSLYLIYKKWSLSPLSYVLSILSKGLSVIFLPVSFLFIYRAQISKSVKKRTFVSYLIILIVGAAALFFSGEKLNTLGETDFVWHDFWTGFTAINSSLKIDGLVLIFLLPLVAGLFISSKKGVEQADAIMLMILVMILSAPLLIAFSDHHNLPYRFVPLIVFFSIGVGMLLLKNHSIVLIIFQEAFHKSPGSVT